MTMRGLGRKAKGTTCYEKDTVVKSLVFGALVVFILVFSGEVKNDMLVFGDIKK